MDVVSTFHYHMYWVYFSGLVQERLDLIANTLEVHFSISPAISSLLYQYNSCPATRSMFVVLKTLNITDYCAAQW